MKVFYINRFKEIKAALLIPYNEKTLAEIQEPHILISLKENGKTLERTDLTLSDDEEIYFNVLTADHTKHAEKANFQTPQYRVIGSSHDYWKTSPDKHFNTRLAFYTTQDTMDDTWILREKQADGTIKQLPDIFYNKNNGYATVNYPAKTGGLIARHFYNMPTQTIMVLVNNYQILLRVENANTRPKQDENNFLALPPSDFEYITFEELEKRDSTCHCDMEAAKLALDYGFSNPKIDRVTLAGTTYISSDKDIALAGPDPYNLPDAVVKYFVYDSAGTIKDSYQEDIIVASWPTTYSWGTTHLNTAGDKLEMQIHQKGNPKPALISILHDDLSATENRPNGMRIVGIED